MTKLGSRNLEQKKSTIEVLNSTLRGQSGTVCIHSSLAHVNKNGAKNIDDILAWLHQISRNGWTVALPSFTFSFCAEQRVNLKTAVSETGILSDLVLKNFNFAVRTPDPIYSHVVIGPRASELCELEPKICVWTKLNF